MVVTKSISIDYDDLMKIAEKIKRGEYENLSQFIKAAIKEKLGDT